MAAGLFISLASACACGVRAFAKVTPANDLTLTIRALGRTYEFSYPEIDFDGSEYYLKNAAAVADGIFLDTVTRPFDASYTVDRNSAEPFRYVAEKNGVIYYNDSKGTNPDAAIQGIRAMSRPTVLIGGGFDKEIPFDDWIEAFDGKVKCLVLIGQTKKIIADCARAHGFTAIRTADTFREAFDICVETAEPGDAVLLSPACACWGMFENYEERGRIFREYVHELKGG